MCIGYEAGAQEASALRIGDSLFGLGDYTRAIQKYEELTDSPKKVLKLATAYEALGNNSKAISYYEQLIETEKSNPGARYKYGKLLYKMARYRNADSVFAELSKHYPQNPNFQYQLGVVKEKLEDSTAIQHYEAAYAIDTLHVDALFKIGKLHLEKRRFETADKFIDKGLEFNARSVRFLMLKGLSAYHQKKYHDAIATYESLLELKQKNTRLLEQLALSYGQTNQFEKAVEYFTLLINQYDDKNPSWHYNIGKSFMALGDFERGRRHVEIAAALKDVPLDAEYTSIAISYNREGNYKKAMEFLQKAVNENPSNETALYQLAVAADNVYKDKTLVLTYYEAYMQVYKDKGRYSEIALSRLRDIRTELHFNKD